MPFLSPDVVSDEIAFFSIKFSTNDSDSTEFMFVNNNYGVNSYLFV